MKTFLRMTIPTTCLVAAAAMAQGPGAHQPATKKVASPEVRWLAADAKVGGESFGALTARWWQWALSVPTEPYLDPDGRLCEVGQEGPVWFLAGTDGSFSAHRRTTGVLARSCKPQRR